jgi:hypothetical protein
MPAVTDAGWATFIATPAMTAVVGADLTGAALGRVAADPFLYRPDIGAFPITVGL